MSLLLSTSTTVLDSYYRPRINLRNTKLHSYRRANRDGLLDHALSYPVVRLTNSPWLVRTSYHIPQNYQRTMCLLPQAIYNERRELHWDGLARVCFETEGPPPYTHDIGFRLSDIYPRPRSSSARCQQGFKLRGAHDRVGTFGDRAKISHRVNVCSSLSL